MTEKYSRNNKEGEDNVDKVTYFLKDEKIRVIFHLPDSRIIPCVQEFRKPGSDQKSNLSDLISHYDPDVFTVAPKKQYLYAKMLHFLKKEQMCLMNVKAAEKEVQEIIQASPYAYLRLKIILSSPVILRKRTFNWSYLFTIPLEITTLSR